MLGFIGKGPWHESALDIILASFSGPSATEIKAFRDGLQCLHLGKAYHCLFCGDDDDDVDDDDNDDEGEEEDDDDDNADDDSWPDTPSK